MSFDRDRYKVDVLRKYLSDDRIPAPEELYQWPPDDREDAAAHIDSVREYWNMQATKAGPVAAICKRFAAWDRDNGVDAVASLAAGVAAAPASAAEPTGAELNAIARTVELCRRNDRVAAQTGMINAETLARAARTLGAPTAGDHLTTAAGRAGLTVVDTADRKSVESALGLSSRLTEINAQVRQADVMTAAHLLRDDIGVAISITPQGAVTLGGREIRQEDVDEATRGLDRKSMTTANRAARTALRSLSSVVGTPAFADLVVLQAISSTTEPGESPGAQETLWLINKLSALGFDRAGAAVVALRSPVAAYQPDLSAPAPAAPKHEPRPAPEPEPVIDRRPTPPSFVKTPPAPAPQPVAAPPVAPAPVPPAQWAPPPPAPQQWAPPQPQYNAPYPMPAPPRPMPGKIPAWLWVTTVLQIISCFGIVGMVLGLVGMSRYGTGRPSRSLLMVAAILEFVVGGFFVLACIVYISEAELGAFIYALIMVCVLMSSALGHLNLRSRAAA